MKWEYVLKTSTKKIVSNVCVYKKKKNCQYCPLCFRSVHGRMGMAV